MSSQDKSKITDVIKTLVKKGMSIDDATEIAFQVVDVKTEDKKTAVSKRPSKPKKVVGGAGEPSAPAVKTEKLKTQMCKFFSSSKGCENGERCKFAHGSDELRCYNLPYEPVVEDTKPKKTEVKKNISSKLKTQMCRFAGKCRFEDKCRFAHSEDELRKDTESDSDAESGEE
jgi:hypothetical protein